MLYVLLKFVHVVAAMVWTGGLVAITVLTGRLAGNPDPSLVAALARQTKFIGTRVLGPSAGLTLLAGLGLIGAGHLGFPFWVAWGLGSFLAAGAVGGALVRPAAVELDRCIAERIAGQRVATLQGRIARLQLVIVLLLISAAGAMVLKPAL